MIVLDTNVVSELMHETPAEPVRAWGRTVPAARRFLTAVTVAELSYGVARLPIGRRRDRMAEEVTAVVRDEFSDRILVFDVAAAERFGALVADRLTIGRPIGILDAQIAAVCLQHGASLATRNTRDFEDLGLTLINPWEGG